MTTDAVIDTEKRGRGRPPVMEQKEYQFFRQLFGDHIQTRRGLLDKHYEIEAFSVITDMQNEGIEGLEFLRDQKQEKCKSGILRELGHFHPDDIRQLALEICEAAKEEKRTIREWASLLKDVRLRISETVSENNEVSN